MRITQGSFSFLPDLTDEQIRRQIEYCLSNGWAVSIEHADELRDRNTWWDMWGEPLYGAGDTAAVMAAIAACRKSHASSHIRIQAFDRALGHEALRLSFIINRPRKEAVFRLERHDMHPRAMRSRMQAYAAERAAGGRF